MSGWSCPHERDGTCAHLKGKPCDPGQSGCVLSGRFAFANPTKNRKPRPKKKAEGKTAGAEERRHSGRSEAKTRNPSSR